MKILSLLDNMLMKIFERTIDDVKFYTWYKNATIPMTDGNGIWFDADNGVYFKGEKSE